MKKRFYKFALIMLSLGVFMNACNSDDEETEEPTPTPQPAPSNTPTFEGADATLVAINTKTMTETPFGNVPIEMGTGVAAFFNATGDALVDAGTVNLNESALTQYSNNSYVFTPSATQPTGLDFSSGTDWEISGANGIAAFTHSPAFTFPNAGEVTSASTITKSDGYVLTVNNISNADSIIYMVGAVMKTQAGNTNSCSFSADELSGVPTGTSVVQAAAYAYDSEDISGKNVYFVKETVVSKTVTIE